MGKLQATRREAIEDLIAKYKKQVDDIFHQASQPLPKFSDCKDEETGEIKVTSEQQVYAFIDVRKKALNNANDMLLIINELETEINDPNYKRPSEEEPEDIKKVVNPAKRYSKR